MKKLCLLFFSIFFLSCTDDTATTSATEGLTSSTTDNPVPTTDPQIPTTTNDPTLSTDTTAESTGTSVGSTGETTNGEECNSNTTKFDKGGGLGEAFDPFLICTVEQLKDLADRIDEGKDKHFKLIKDLDFAEYYAKNNPPFQISKKATNGFSGSFDGDFKFLKNFFYEDANAQFLALFEFGLNATFKNLILENFNVKGEKWVGSLVSICAGCDFKNIQGSPITVESTKNGGVGGLVGAFSGSHFDNVHLSSVKVFFHLVEKQDFEGAGGIGASYSLSHVDAASKSSLVNNVSVVGEIREVAPFIKEPYNFSNIQDGVGGLFGTISVFGVSNFESEILNSWAQVNILAGSTLQNVGGLVGSCSQASIQNTEQTEKGTLSYQGRIMVPLAADVGGAIGRLSNCNIHDVVVVANIEASLHVGGLVGETISTVSNDEGVVIERSRAKGSLIAGPNGFQSAGGLVGLMTQHNQLKTSWSAVSIQSKGTEIGGLIGRVYSVNDQDLLMIEDCFSMGDILSPVDADGKPLLNSKFVGGILGAIEEHETSLNIHRVYSAGQVQGGTHVGGLIGGFKNPPLVTPSVVSNAFTTSLVQAGDPTKASGIQWAKGGIIFMDVYWWSQNPNSTEQECFENFNLPGCETADKAAFHDINHPVYADPQWDFGIKWQWNPGALPTLIF